MSKGKPDILLIVSIVVASLILAGAIVYAMVQPLNPAGQATSMATSVNVPLSLQKCVQGDTCLMVETSCDLCQSYVAINRHHEDVFTQMYEAACDGFRGKTCPPQDMKSYPSCVNGSCALLPLP